MAFKMKGFDPGKGTGVDKNKRRLKEAKKSLRNLKLERLKKIGNKNAQEVLKQSIEKTKQELSAAGRDVRNMSDEELESSAKAVADRIGTKISAKDFGNQNSLYRYTEFQWRISGTKEEVAKDNQITIYDLELEYKDISKKLFPLQLWKPTRDSYEDVQKKLLLLKTD